VPLHCATAVTAPGPDACQNRRAMMVYRRNLRQLPLKVRRNLPQRRGRRRPRAGSGPGRRAAQSLSPPIRGGTSTSPL
jgi:hypothetical protein